VEIHGNDIKHSKDINWRYEGPNVFLDKFPGLRHGLYYGNPSADIPGVDSVTPNLRSKMLEGPYKVRFDGSGYLLTIKDGAVSGNSFQLGGSDVNNVKVDPKDGGTCVCTWRTQHVGLSAEIMGRIDSMDGKQVELLQAPADAQSGNQPERLTKAEKAAKAKAEAQAAFTSPFKFGAGENGETVDRTPLPEKDQNAPEAGDVFGDKVAAGETTPANVVDLAKAAAKKPAAKKVVARKGKG
jgi:hypothetical protein